MITFTCIVTITNIIKDKNATQSVSGQIFPSTTHLGTLRRSDLMQNWQKISFHMLSSRCFGQDL